MTFSQRAKRRIADSDDDGGDAHAPATPRTPARGAKPATQTQTPRNKRRDAEDSDADSGADSAAAEAAGAPGFADRLDPSALAPLFVQTFLRRFKTGATEEEVVKLYKHSCVANEKLFNKDALKPFLAALNEDPSHLDLNLATMVHPQTGVRSYALVNTNPDEVSQLSTQMNPNEIAFFKRLIYLIMTADDDVFQITTSDALRESKVAKLKATETEALLDSIIQNGWLDLNNGWLSLSLRALMELKTYLREEYEDSVQYCSVCKDLVTTNYERCAIGACPGRLHKFCAGRYFGVNARVCPHEGCGSAWEGITPVPSNSGARRGDGSSKRRQMRSDNADSDDSDADKEGNLDGFVVADGEDEGGEEEEE